MPYHSVVLYGTQKGDNVNIQFVAGVALITSDSNASSRFYLEGLQLPLENQDGYLSTDSLPGVKHFGIWPLEAAARSCFGKDSWPDHIPVPQATIEFELEDINAVQAAVEELTGMGYESVHDAKKEPWGQTVARFLGPEGLLIGLSYTPWMHKELPEGDE